MTSEKTEVTIPALDPREALSANEFLVMANDFEIDSPEVRAIADEDLARLKKQRSRLEDKRKELKSPIIEAGRRVDEMFRPMIDLLDRAGAILGGKIITFDRELAAIRAKQVREAQAAAEAQRKQLAEQAERLEAAGAVEAAASVKEAASLVSAPVIPLEVQASERSTTKRVTWSAEVTDVMALVRAVAAGQVPLEALSPNMTYLNGRARLEKEALKIDGVKSVGTESLTSKRALA